MVLQQVTLDFPDEIWAGIQSGLLSNIGSVVRDANGTIITHVPEAKLPTKVASYDLSRFAANIKDPKVQIVIALGAITAIGVVALIAAKRKSGDGTDVPAIIQGYNRCVSAYLTAIREESIAADIVDQLIESLLVLKGEVDEENLTLAVSNDGSDALVTIVREYTKKLAAANDSQIGDLDEATPDTAENTIYRLLKYLETQRRIIGEAG